MEAHTRLLHAAFRNPCLSLDVLPGAGHAATLKAVCASALPATIRSFVSTSASADATPMQSTARDQRGQQWQASLRQQPGASTSAKSGQQQDWTKAVRNQFSVRPSYLSPLYTAFHQEREKEARRQLVGSLLDSHRVLAEDVDGMDEVQRLRNVRQRVSNLRQLSSQLELLRPRTNLPACTARSHMFGFYSVLEGETQRAERDSEELHKVATGQVSIWDHWEEQFMARYRDSPGLEPLDAIYAKPDVLQELSRNLRGMSRDALGRLTQHATQGGAVMDITGTAFTKGKRKTSAAKVTMTPNGQGRITVNGQPYDRYFPDLSVRVHLLQPLVVAGAVGKFDVDIAVKGGGMSAQAQAARTGLARALRLYRDQVGAGGMAQTALYDMARWDGRQVERKKPARAKARAGYTWVKR